MMLPNKDYFLVNELAAELKCSAEDIFHHFINNRICLGIRVHDDLFYGMDKDSHIIGIYKVNGVITIPRICARSWELGIEEISRAGGFGVEIDYPPKIMEASYIDEASFPPPVLHWAPGRNWNNPETDHSLIKLFLVGKNNLYKIRKDTVVIHSVECDRFKREQLEAGRDIEIKLDPRAETTYLNIIGSLVNMMLGKTPAGKPYSDFKSQAAIIDGLLANFPNRQGITKRTLEDKFAEANRSLTDI